ncbi:MAG: hypothetical protein O7H41_06220 [Planctomycetota bacterium]|nr:hypothetical protein [Planctomycetota bacterium]
MRCLSSPDRVIRLGLALLIVVFLGSSLPALARPKKWAGEAVIRRQLKKSKRSGDFKKFVKTYNKMIGTRDSRYRLDLVKAIQKKPLSFPARAYALTDAVHAAFTAGPKEPRRALDPIGEALDVKFEPADLPGLEKGLEGEAHLDQLEAVVEGAGEQARLVFESMKEKEQVLLASQVLILTDQFLQHIYLDSDRVNFEANKLAVRWGGKLDFAGFLAAVEGISRLIEPEFLEGFVRDVKGMPQSEGTDGVKGSVLLRRETPWGPMIIGGPGRNEYTGFAALIIDIGGDDTYTGAPGSALGPARPISIIIDVSGNDAYRSEGSGIAYGQMGVGIIFDLAGKDEYEGGRRSLGCGLFGVGILWDAGGNDTYIGAEYTQGAAAFGIGALIDHAGDDIYRADLYAQGFGLTRGFGVLWDGADGDDTYRCTGKHPSVYQDEGESNGMGQGIGMGFRGDPLKNQGVAAGGIGALLDGGGNDRYRAGQFGLGCGYYFGLGIVRDRGGSDVYEASRYGLATGAHCALGIVIDDEGNDRYSGRGGANLAGNWDLTISYLIDGGGDDSYKAPGLSIGAATITSLAVLCDAEGSDRYESKATDVLGHGGNPQDARRGALSFGFLMDFGTGKDEYVFKEGKGSTPRGEKMSNLKVNKTNDGRNELGLGYFLDTPKAFE